MTPEREAMRQTVHTHRLVRETAIGMGFELYDTMMSDNGWYSQWKLRNPDCKTPKALALRFVFSNLARLLPQARAILAGQLARTTDPALQEAIYEALILDAGLTRGRGGLRPARQVLLGDS